MNDEQKLKMLHKFQKDFQKLMNKYPDILVCGNCNGDVQGHLGLQSPSYKNKCGNVLLTYEGKVLQ